MIIYLLIYIHIYIYKTTGEAIFRDKKEASIKEVLKDFYQHFIISYPFYLEI